MNDLGELYRALANFARDGSTIRDKFKWRQVSNSWKYRNKKSAIEMYTELLEFTTTPSVKAYCVWRLNNGQNG